MKNGIRWNFDTVYKGFDSSGTGRQGTLVKEIAGFLSSIQQKPLDSDKDFLSLLAVQQGRGSV